MHIFFVVTKWVKVWFLTILIAAAFIVYLNFKNSPLPSTDNSSRFSEESHAEVVTSFFENVPTKGECETDIPILNDDQWLLVWHDEFTNDCIDNSKWNLENWDAEKNNELQYYIPENVVVEEGRMRLISKKEWLGDSEYTSGAVHTKGKFNMLYGKIEMRAKLPIGKGVFPAFWLMADKEDTWLPEIDIMEMLGHKPDEIWMVVHWLNENGRLMSDFDFFKGPDFSADYHTFGMEWTPNSITWFIDGEVRFTSNVHVPKEPMYIYVNTAIGGNWPGSPDWTTTFPTTFDIDYIRVFSYKENSLYDKAF
ncbi:glycoside hydrolase family 16 protein [Sporosarcina sp. Sa2YVA2]|uniref:licheninase n=1 Tax=Sporosarcina quadrami TaxID=2762234 RepID=A0ABR8U8Z0_9BACL|nr:glycoside hydrolase family 16 protein [Sporosarcina quadrami]MBD7984498.1 glycoside hydrolase family 16 protein [Sporosarcina quadrami]